MSAAVLPTALAFARGELNMIDRAALVTRAMVKLLVNGIRTEEILLAARGLLPDEFADERRQVVSDRSLDPDA